MKNIVLFVSILFTSLSYASECGVVKSIFLEENNSYRFYLTDGNTSGVIKDSVLVDLVKASLIHDFEICYQEYAVFGGVFMIERTQKKKNR